MTIKLEILAILLSIRAVTNKHLLRERVSNETKYQLRFRKCTLCAREFTKFAISRDIIIIS